MTCEDQRSTSDVVMEVTAFVSEDGPSAEDLRTGRGRPGAWSPRQWSAKETGNATSLENRAMKLHAWKSLDCKSAWMWPSERKDTEAAGESLGNQYETYASPALDRRKNCAMRNWPG